MAKRCRVGDIIEIPTSVGLAYAQFSHSHREFGALLRVLPGTFKERPPDFNGLAGLKEKYVTFFPLQAAVNKSIFSVVAHAEVPGHAAAFPLFRAAGIRDPGTGKVDSWWLWDGEREWRVGEITSEQRKLPLRGIWNDTLLIERIESGWTPETDPT